MSEAEEHIADPRAIGVFDSGVGGLTVLHECLVNLPNEDFVYLGDTANFPYGPRELADVRRLAFAAARSLVDLGVKLIVVACNSATSAALAQLQTTFSTPMVGVVMPERARQYRPLAADGWGSWPPRRPSGRIPIRAHCSRSMRV
jgi:glutamate racemase